MSFHVYWLERKARNVWVGWVWGKPTKGRPYEYPVTLDDLSGLPPTSRIYVDARRWHP